MNKMTYEEVIQAGQAKQDVWVVWNDEYSGRPKFEKFHQFSTLRKDDFNRNQANWAFYANYWFAWADHNRRL